MKFTNNVYLNHNDKIMLHKIAHQLFISLKNSFLMSFFYDFCISLFLVNVFIYSGFNVAFNTLCRSYHNSIYGQRKPVHTVGLGSVL